MNINTFTAKPSELEKVNDLYKQTGISKKLLTIHSLVDTLLQIDEIIKRERNFIKNNVLCRKHLTEQYQIEKYENPNSTKTKELELDIMDQEYSCNESRKLISSLKLDYSETKQKLKQLF
jgi:ribosome biogenesis GTPase A|tara:strand:- start:1838 stop:2197 length:360 start_codon:yes stop_codon:yes gene_type:complete